MMTRPKDILPNLLDRIIRSHWVGREGEMKEALALWQRAAAGEAQFLLIGGEPGVGKTRFVRELAETVQMAGASILTGECYAEGDTPYAPLAQIIWDALETSSQAGFNLPDEVLSDLLPVSPSLRLRFNGLSPGQNLDRRSEQQRVFESFVTFCTQVSSLQPLLLFIDDVHWADADTLFLLRYLARRGRKLPLFVVMTYRQSGLEMTSVLNEVLVDLNRERLARQINLDRFSRQETNVLLAAMFSEEITPDFLDSIFRQTEGNPFFIEEICKTLIDTGQISYQDGRWLHPVMADIKIPQSVRAAILSRVQKLPQPTREALSLASILGREFDFETLKLACDLGEEALIDALENAARAQLIVEVQPGQAATSRFSFVHALIPTTLRENIIHIRRKRLHLRAAQAIESVHPDDFEVLAYQYAEAGEVERARQFYVRAGDRAQISAPGEAVRFYRAALERWPDDDQSDRAEILARLGYCSWVIDDVQASLKSYETAYTLFDALGNRTQSGEMQRMIGRMYWQQAQRQQASDHFHRALAILEQGPETLELARAINSISQMYMLAQDGNQAIVWGERALKLAESLGAEDVVVNALNNIGSSYAERGDFEKGISILQESLQRSIAAGLPADASRAYFNSGVMYQRQCRYKNARQLIEELYTYSSKFYAKTYINLALWRLAWINWYTGQWETALKYRAQRVESGDVLYEIWANRIFGMIDLDLGLVKEALHELEDSLDLAVHADEYQTTVTHLGQLARAYIVLGQDEKTGQIIKQILKFISTRNYNSNDSIMPLLIACHWNAARPTANSLRIALECLACLEQHAQEFHTEEASAALAEGRGCVLLGEHHPLEAAENFRQAVSCWDSIDRRYDQARALGYLGRALASLGDAAAASTALQQALEIVDALAEQLDQVLQASFRASPMVQQIHQAFEELSQPILRKDLRQEAGGLTEREIEVLKFVAQGLTNAQIANQLFLSPLTINAHLRSIFNKLDVTTRTAAVHKAAEKGLV
jgi:ATP/maltotriose-dependent transcriptional regulator MalT